MLHIIWSIIVGFIVGWIARAVMPGVQHLGFLMTTLLGIGGVRAGGRTRAYTAARESRAPGES